MDAKILLGGKAARTIVDFASIVLCGIVLTRVVQLVFNAPGANFFVDVLPWLVASIIIGAFGAYLVKIFLPGWYWWEVIAPIGILVIGCICFATTFDQSTNILLLYMLAGLFCWNLACCDVHLRDTMLSQQATAGIAWLSEISMPLLVATGVLLPFIVDPYVGYYVMIVYLAVLAAACVLMIISSRLHVTMPADASTVGLTGMTIRSRAKIFFDGKNVVRAVVLFVCMVLLEYYRFQAIQARSWFYSMPSLTFFYDIDLYSITYYGILAGALAAFFVLRLVFEQGKYRTSCIEAALTIAFLAPVTFLLFLVIGNALNLALLFMFCQAAFVGMAFVLFIALLGHGIQVRMPSGMERSLP